MRRIIENILFFVLIALIALAIMGMGAAVYSQIID
jgi:hypothetical protein